MIASLIVRTAEHGHRDVDRFGPWVAAIEQLQAEWNAGRRPSPADLAAFLAFVPPDQHSDATQDLVAEHLLLSWRERQALKLESYFKAMPLTMSGWTSPSSVPVDLVEDEFLARHQQPHGDAPDLNEYEQRFPGRSDITERLGEKGLENSRFVKIRRVGHGAMSEVWQSLDHRTRQVVAIKCSRQKLNASNAPMAEQLAGEARVMAAINHPRVIAVRECFTSSSGVAFGVMPWVAGPTLSQRIADHHAHTATCPRSLRRREQADLLRLFADVCDTMAWVHGQEIIHRDLKPGNIAVTDSEEVVILDWGMACKCRRATTMLGSMGASLQSDQSANAMAAEATEIAGTPAYMAPEQVDGFADERSDVFGLGAVLYELLTGRPPYDWPNGHPPKHWQSRVRAADVPAPRRVCSWISRALDSTCRCALSRVPEDRYESAGELSKAIRSYLDRNAAGQRSWWPKFLSFRRKHRK